MKKKFIESLNGKVFKKPPVWLMRQAGRYLPEYRKIREEAGGFLELCYNSDLSTEVALQPIRRFSFDAAILFADILLLPQALGMELWFETGEGPRLNSLNNGFKINNLKSPSDIHETLAPIYQTVKNLAGELSNDTALIGFAGAPWTVATYMIHGKSSKNHIEARNFINSNPSDFDKLINLLTLATIEYLSEQIKAGAEVIKIFDSWAGALSKRDAIKYGYSPVVKIAVELKRRYPLTPIIIFPKGVGIGYKKYAESQQFSGLALDTSVPIVFAKGLQANITIQGNLDPLLLVTGGKKLKSEVLYLMEQLSLGPYIFNLGHGITPDADPKNVELLLEYIRE